MDSPVITVITVSIFSHEQRETSGFGGGVKVTVRALADSGTTTLTIKSGNDGIAKYNFMFLCLT